MTIWTQPDAADYSSHDRIAKQLEIEAIAKYIKDGMTVLDVGCGDGETAIELAKRFNIVIHGIDSSVAMLKQAKEQRDLALQGQTTLFAVNDIAYPKIYWVDDVSDIGPNLGWHWIGTSYDLIYTERCLINLPDWETQKRAIGNIAKVLKPGGLYVMQENSWEGLQIINNLRERAGLLRIEPPGHNRYLRDEEVEEYAHPIIEVRSVASNELRDWNYSDVSVDGLRYEGADDYSATYYLLSRVVNAALAAQEGKEPDYDSLINKLALRLAPIAGLRGQGRIWLWRKG